MILPYFGIRVDFLCPKPSWRDSWSFLVIDSSFVPPSYQVGDELERLLDELSFHGAVLLLKIQWCVLLWDPGGSCMSKTILGRLLGRAVEIIIVLTITIVLLSSPWHAGKVVGGVVLICGSVMHWLFQVLCFWSSMTLDVQNQITFGSLVETRLPNWA